jgi:hypothetical protein
MHLVEPHPTHKLADAGDRLAPVEGLCVVRLGRLHDGQCDSAEEPLLEVHQGEVDCHTLVPGRIGKPCGDPVAVRLVGDLRPKRRPVVRPGGLLHVGQAFRPLTRQMQAAPEQITGRPHLRGIDRGLDEAFDRMAELYPGLSQAWRKRLTSSREGRQDWLHSLRNNIVHYGSNRDASGRYAEAIVETAFPFLEEMFQRITGNTVSLPHLLMEWIYREVEVARLVRRDLQNEQKPPEPYAIKTLQHYVLWTYAAWPLPVMISTRSWSAGRQTGSSILSDGKEHLLRLGKTGSW